MSRRLDRHAGLIPVTARIDYGDMIARDQVPGAKPLEKFGLNPEIKAAIEDIWDQGGVYAGWLTTATTITVEGTSDDDSPSGTKCLTMRVWGLDADFEEITEDFVMEGTTPVVSDKSFIRVNRAQMLTAGSAGTNGKLIVKSGSTVLAAIEAGYGQTEMALWTVPAGYEGQLHDVWIGVSSKEAALIRLLVREFGTQAWIVKRAIPIAEGTALLHWRFPLIIPEKADIRLAATSTATGAFIGAGFALHYEETS